MRPALRLQILAQQSGSTSAQVACRARPEGSSLCGLPLQSAAGQGSVPKPAARKSTRIRIMKKSLAALTAATALISMTSAADAATIVQHIPVSNGNVVTIQQFDPNLGALKSVGISYFHTTSKDISNFSWTYPPQQGSADFTIRQIIGITPSDINSPSLPSIDRTIVAYGDLSQPSFKLTLSIQDEEIRNSGFEGFIGASKLNYTPFASAEILASSVSYYERFSNYEGSYVLTYTYSEAAAVPEPATWAMMITGFGLTGAALRARNRRSPVAA